MTGPAGDGEESALWRRWRAAADGAADDGGSAPDLLLLAAYAEDRLEGTARDAVERWLAAHPERIEDVLAARRPQLGKADREPPPRAVARAMALVAAPDPQVLPFRRPTPRAPRWRVAVVWSGMAASIAATGFLGFALGSDAYANLIGGTTLLVGQELFDPPSGILTGLGEESDT